MLLTAQIKGMYFCPKSIKKISLMSPAKSTGKLVQSWRLEVDQRKTSVQTSNVGSHRRENHRADPALLRGGTSPLVPETSLVHGSIGTVTRLHGLSSGPTSNFSWRVCSEIDAKGFSVGMNGMRCFCRRCLQNKFN